jgi:tryptophanyl-tRNA synthetase
MILTGIKPTGTFHLGNYISTIHPLRDKNTLILIANQHALISNNNIKENTLDLFKIFLSFNFKNIILQSSLPEISELNWILSCFTEVGFLNRSHAFKSLKEENIKNKRDENKNISAGLFNYPTLMTADNAIFDTDYVAVGQDQIQHIEMAKEIVRKFNNQYNTDILKIPEPIISKIIIQGYDGNKMSKSNNNIIPLFDKNLKKNLFKMKTNSKNEGEPKYFIESPICALYASIANDEEIIILKNDMQDGIGWGEVKNIVYDKLSFLIEEAKYNYFNTFKDFTLSDCFDYTYEDTHLIMIKVMDKMKKIKELVY